MVVAESKGVAHKPLCFTHEFHTSYSYVFLPFPEATILTSPDGVCPSDVLLNKRFASRPNQFFVDLNTEARGHGCIDMAGFNGQDLRILSGVSEGDYDSLEMVLTSRYVDRSASLL